MPYEELVSYLGITEREDAARLETAMTVAGAAAEALTTEITLTGEIDFLAESSRSIGLELEMERGDGTMAPVTLSELGQNLTLTSSLDGVSELTFTRMRSGQSPLLHAELRAPRRVRLGLLRGTLGGERRWDVFDGFVRDVSAGIYPAAAEIAAHDGGSVLSAPLFYVLAERSYLTRQEIWTAICRQYRIPPGSFGAPDGGGRVFKPINEAGQKTVGQFFAEFLAPTGYRAVWNGRALDVVKFALTDPPVRALTWSDIRGDIALGPPSMDAPNAVRFGGAIFPYTGPDLTGVTVETVDVVGPYMPVAAVQAQDHVTGTITNVAPVVSAGPLVSSVVTTTTRDGGNITGVSVAEYGWFAPLACNKRQTTAGAITFNNQFPVWKFPDGTWRTQDRETWGLVSQRVLTRSFNASGLKTLESTYLAQYATRETYTASILNGQNGQLNYRDCLVNDAGHAWIGGYAVYNSVEHLQRTEYYSADGRIASAGQVNLHVGTSGSYPQIGGPPPVGPVYSGLNVYVFGPSSAPRYAIWRSGGAATVWTAVEVWSATGPESHSVVTTVPAANVFVWPVIYRAPPPAGTVAFAQPLPLREQLSRLQVPQPASVTQRDSVRIALMGQEIAAALENGWCESLTELHAAAFVELQRLGAIPVTVVTDVDPRLAPGRVVTVPAHPELGHGPVPLLIETSTIALDFESWDAEQTLQCSYLPLELR